MSEKIVWITKRVKPTLEEWGVFKEDSRGRLVPICPICGYRITMVQRKDHPERKRKPRTHECKLPLTNVTLDQLAEGKTVIIKTITGFEFEINVVNIPRGYTDTILRVDKSSRAGG